MFSWIKNNLFICCLAIAVCGAGTTLIFISQKVYDAQRVVKSMDREALKTGWEIRALKAELAYLTRPDRLDEIASAIQSGSTKLPQGDVQVISPVKLSMPQTEPNFIVPSRKPNMVFVTQKKEIKKTNSTDFSNLLKTVGGLDE
jgi:cell division protein FtsL